MLSFLKLCLSEYAENTFLGLLTGIRTKSTGFHLRTFFRNTKHLYKKNEPTFGSSGGGVHVTSAGS